MKHLFVITILGGLLAANSFSVYKSVVFFNDADFLSLEFSPINLMVWAYTIVSLAINGAMFLAVAIVYSHRLTGPHEKIVAALGKIAQGNLKENIRLRKTDHLQEIAKAVNQVVKSHSHSISDLSRAVQSLRSHQKMDAQEIDRQLAAMEAVLDHYNVEQGSEHSCL